MEKIAVTIPRQQLSRERLKINDDDVVKTSFVAVSEERGHLSCATFGARNGEAVEEAMRSGRIVTLDAKYNERFQQWHVRLPRPLQQAAAHTERAGDTAQPPMTTRMWLDITASVTRALEEIIGSCPRLSQASPDAMLAETRSMLASYWICVQSGLCKPALAGAESDAVLAPEHKISEKSEQNRDPIMETIVAATSEHDVDLIEKMIRNNASLSSEAQRRYLGACFDRKRALAAE